MTDDSELKPGPRLDALIAEKVMGWPEYSGVGWPKEYPCYSTGYMTVLKHTGPTEDGTIYVIWSPSTRIEHAWEVAQRLIKYGFGLDISNWDYNRFRVLFHHRDYLKKYHSVTDDDSESIPHAICLAALKAVERTND